MYLNMRVIHPNDALSHVIKSTSMYNCDVHISKTHKYFIVHVNTPIH